MRIFLIVVTVFIVGIRKETRAETKDDVINDFKREMSIMGTMDNHYHSTLTDIGNIMQAKSFAAEYAPYIRDTFIQAMDVEKYASDTNNYMYHFMYFSLTSGVYGTERIAKPKLKNEQAFALAYLAYLAFWQTINFRICGLYYASVPHTSEADLERARECNQLYPFMYWFFVTAYKERITAFRASQTIKMISRDSTSSVHETANYMDKLDLSFMLNEKYFQIMKTKQDFKSLIDWANIQERSTGTGRKFKTIFPTDKEDGITEETSKKVHDLLWNKVLKYLKEDIMKIENFFHWSITGSPLGASQLELNTRCPPYELSLKIWENVPTLISIRNLDPTIHRPMYKIVSELNPSDTVPNSATILRSNAVEMFRIISELTTKYRLGKISSELADEEIDTYKIQPPYTLKTEKEFNIDYVLDYGPEKKI